MNPTEFYAAISNHLQNQTTTASADIVPLSSFGDSSSADDFMQFEDDFDGSEVSKDEQIEESSCFDNPEEPAHGVRSVTIPVSDSVGHSLGDYVLNRIALGYTGTLTEAAQEYLNLEFKDDDSVIRWFVQQFFCVSLDPEVVHIITIEEIKQCSPEPLVITSGVLSELRSLDSAISKSEYLWLAGKIADHQLLQQAMLSEHFSFKDANSITNENELCEYLVGIVTYGHDLSANFSKETKDLISTCEERGMTVFRQMQISVPEERLCVILQHWLQYGQNQIADALVADTKDDWFVNFYKSIDNTISLNGSYSCLTFAMDYDKARVGVNISKLSSTDYATLLVSRYTGIITDADYKMYVSLSSVYDVDFTLYKYAPPFNAYCMDSIAQQLGVEFRAPSDVGRALVIIGAEQHSKIMSCEAPLLGAAPFGKVHEPCIQLLQNNSGIVVHPCYADVPDTLMRFSFKFKGSFRCWAEQGDRMRIDDAVRYNQHKLADLLDNTNSNTEMRKILRTPYESVAAYESVSSCIVERFPIMRFAFYAAYFDDVMRALAPCINIQTQAGFVTHFIKNYVGKKCCIQIAQNEYSSIDSSVIKYTIGSNCKKAKLESILYSIGVFRKAASNANSVRIIRDGNFLHLKFD